MYKALNSAMIITPNTTLVTTEITVAMSQGLVFSGDTSSGFTVITFLTVVVLLSSVSSGRTLDGIKLVAVIGMTLVKTMTWRFVTSMIGV